jgi:D-inositol-3-phosphate glycosyltransferase
MTMKRVAMLSVHTCPLAMLGGKETGGMNVYVRELTTELDRQGIVVDVYTRSQEPGTPVVHGILGEQSRVIHVPAGPEVPYDKNRVYDHLSEFVERVKARVIRENLQYDIIHSHYWLSALAARDLQKTSMSCTSVLLPEPETPVTTVSAPIGIETLTSRRLFS